ncbi:MerR family transcriptional regulator [Paraclostridium ghonii]|uniref:MerR family transcriptional regulator n=1 Tax=Paraclostridium ghonii TaxID=29358 RepID=UPI00202CCDBC|nr:MerR family transcriptional regulator [Paeniclostridium ghonii]MCM0167659.1 MerR family transcriptional regulator [Paeniclostridium ghonii]
MINKTNTKDLFTIGEIAILFDINKKTLRYYDEINLFKPSYIDEKNNYRYYTTNQFEKLNTIIYLKNIGIPLSSIKFHLNNRSISNTLNLFEVQQDIIEQKIEELKFIQNKVKSRINKIKDSLDYKKLNKIIEIDIEERTVAVLKEAVKTNKDLEISIRKLENKANKKSSIFLGEVGVSICKEKLKNKLFKQYDSTFIFVENQDYSNEIIKVLPKGRYACIRFNGLHEDSHIYYEKLLNYIEENNYDILEDSIEITLIDSGLTTNTSEFVTEIQILVKKY